MQISAKIGLFFVIISITLIYSIYERRTYEELVVAQPSLILKKLPAISVNNVYEKNLVTSKDLMPKSKNGLLFVHLWGTWCAPCEAEFPDFVKFAQSVRNEDVKFLVVAVKDELIKVKKFLKQFKDLPDNFILTFDEEGIIQGQLGTARVPETFLFNSKGEHIRKYIGSQKWQTGEHLDYVKSLVSNYKK
jgi:thiol-disulfide isomerase/thioredoxin